MSQKIVGRSVWCPAVQDMVGVTGHTNFLANGLEEFYPKQCSRQKTCEKAKHGHYECLINKRLEGRW